ncbi:sensor histidine kinase VirS [[Clostridium] sordellii]|uniref:sensor histidine kinase n=1 Tax=Paraclostridium sordellii TaxID=1505 RepID=UPI0005E3503A|nr:sensor histidine kinase [Paeniclostridium sordellii]CEN21109.1 sensor histidine kinase VirS [[Clostridium] sordellii] [Paeniclostridium sordellii]CEP40375.1 sensor histidine kinase VirS [[Clostridium] sordellii] [Paeniclostridium sordellii]
MINIQNVFIYLLDFITGIVYLLVFKSIVDNISCKKLGERANYIFIIVVSIFIFIFKFENSIIFILICASFYKINYKQNILMCILISLLYWFLIYIPIEYISLDLVFNINYNSLNFDLNRSSIVVEIESMIIQNILMLIIFKICVQINKIKSVKNIGMKVNYISIFIPILIDILMIIVIFRILAIDKVISKFDIAILITASIIILISKWNHLYILGKSIYSYKLDYENRILKENVLKEQNYYRKINTEKDKVRALYHDMKNHMICIRNLCEEKNTDELIKYIDSMEIKISNYNKLNQNCNTGNMIVDSILRVKKNICSEKNIDFFIDVDFSKSDFMDMVDICTIFSNLIDNAIEACDKINDKNVPKKIILKSKYIDGFCIIFIENTKINEVKQIKKLFLTSKNNLYMHGIGLKNVKKVINKYFGEVSFSYSKKIFTVKIMIPIKKK